jgi:zinc/manganese transport system permease protein
VQALALAIGFLLLSLYGGVLGDLESLLFGNLLGISDGKVLLLACVAAAGLVALACMARPLLFASVDPDMAVARGLRVRALSVGFLLLLGSTVAAASQITGVMLVFALLVAPAASAQCLSARPAASIVIGIATALSIVWLGLAISYFSIYPAGFFIATISFACYLLARLLALVRTRARGPRTRAPRRVSRPARGA